MAKPTNGWWVPVFCMAAVAAQVVVDCNNAALDQTMENLLCEGVLHADLQEYSEIRKWEGNERQEDRTAKKKKKKGKVSLLVAQPLDPSYSSLLFFFLHFFF